MQSCGFLLPFQCMHMLGVLGGNRSRMRHHVVWWLSLHLGQKRAQKSIEKIKIKIKLGYGRTTGLVSSYVGGSNAIMSLSNYYVCFPPFLPRI
ncbi:hypothetical protein EV356DRAFT_306298 [Viridothelium virens]|uniref:Uncharacterized protein n=1 Tax=Viridothelium virens TaxID=1048519 RepID=A0A6A6HJQ3_VIRVR|nr:hypothetical protein EV356DRAFT_306298 [Viridothelium virens]